MKANQAFKANDEAVSPVIGVILMVAITVVLAAVVFVLVSNLSKNSNNSAPNISFNQDKSGKTLTIVSADASNWKDVTATISGVNGVANTGKCVAGGIDTATPTTVAQTAATTALALNAKSGILTPAAGQVISGGNAISITETGGAAGDQCVLSLTYTPANQLLGTWTFQF